MGRHLVQKRWLWIRNRWHTTGLLPHSSSPASTDSRNTTDTASAELATSPFELTPDGDRDSIARQAGGGAIWVFLALAVGKALTLGTTLILARLLEPDDFGLVSFAMILIGAFTLLQDFGVRDALVYDNRDTKEIAGTALTINVSAAVLMFILATLIAPALARFDGEPAISPVVTVLALGLIISAAGSVQNALLMKKLAFRRKFLPEVVPLILSGCTSITLALLGLGVWSLVFGYLVRMATSTLLLWRLSGVYVLPTFRRSVAVELLRYGRHVSFSAVIGFAVMNVDYFLVGHYFPSASLGIYTLAFMIASLPSTTIGWVASTAMFPAYSRLRAEPEELRSLFSRALGIVSTLSISLGLLIGICSPIYIPVILGTKWLDLIDPLRVLTVFGVLRAVEYIFVPVYRATGHPQLAWRFNLARLVVIAPLMLLTVRYGLVAIALVQVLVAVLFVPLNGIVLCRLIRFPFASLWRLSAAHLIGLSGAATFLTAWTTVPLLEQVSSGLVGRTLFGVVGLSVYIAIVFALDTRIMAVALSGITTASLKLRMVPTRS